MREREKGRGKGTPKGLTPLVGQEIPEPAEISLINQLPAVPRDRSFGRADLILRG